MRQFFRFPNPVNEHAARMVAFGVVCMAVLIVGFHQHWLLIPLAYGFVARVLTGPRLSPLGRVVTQVAVPALGKTPKLVPGPPKRFAQGIGVVFSVTALVLYFLVGATTAADVTVAVLAVAAGLEAFVGLCLGCVVFAGLMRIGIIPESACEACNDIWSRVAA